MMGRADGATDIEDGPTNEDGELLGHVEALFVAEAGGEPMDPREEVSAVPGGLEGDRYCTGRGYDSSECNYLFVRPHAVVRSSE